MGAFSVKGMNLQTYLQARARGVDLLAEAAALSKSEIMALGASPDDADHLIRLAEPYFGKTPYTRKQARALAGARRRGHGLSVLARIEKYVARVRNRHHAWDLRVELCHAPANNVDGLARARLREILTPSQPQPQVSHTRYSNGLGAIRITDKAMTIEDFRAIISHADGALAGFRALVAGNASGGAVKVSTSAIVYLDQLDRIVNGEGEEVTIELSNGAVVSGAQYIQRALAQHGEAVLVHPLAGPVDAFRTQRIANDKQRAILKAKFRECVWPGCSVPFDDCQIHHIEAWNHGGYTNLQNLVPLCAYHNGLNQDDPLGPAHRGRITLIDGHLAWLSPKTGRPMFLKHNLRPPP